MKTAPRALLALLALAVVGGLGASTSANTYLDWADKFTSAHVMLITDGTSTRGGIQHFWGDVTGGTSNEYHDSWQGVGTQTIGGRTNAVEQVQFDFTDLNGSNCIDATVTLSRWRTAAHSIGSTCSVTPATSLGVRDATVGSCSVGNSHYLYSHRLQPAWDFNSESGVTVDDWTGYISRVSVSAYNVTMVPTNGYVDGCFVIYWTN